MFTQKGGGGFDVEGHEQKVPPLGILLRPSEVPSPDSERGLSITDGTFGVERGKTWSMDECLQLRSIGTGWAPNYGWGRLPIRDWGEWGRGLVQLGLVYDSGLGRGLRVTGSGQGSVSRMVLVVQSLLLTESRWQGGVSGVWGSPRRLRPGPYGRTRYLLFGNSGLVDLGWMSFPSLTTRLPCPSPRRARKNP